MATDLEKLVVQLSADIRGYQRELDRARGVTRSRAREIESQFAKMNRNVLAGFNTLGASAAKAFAVIGGAAGAKQLIDSSIKIQNALKVTGLSGEELTKTYDQLFASAQRNAAPIESLVQLYSRVSLVQNELGVSSEQIARLTDTVGMSLRLSGSSAQEASGALLQLAQALGGGKIQAEEYNSLIDGMPGLLQAAAAGIKQAGGSVAQLTKLVKAGELSSRAFFDGIEAGRHVLEDRLAGATDTIEGRFVRMQNSLIKAAGEFNTSTKAAETFGAAIDRISQNANNLDFNGMIGEVQRVVKEMGLGIEKANELVKAFGHLASLDRIGAGLVKIFDTDGDGKVTAFNGGLTISSTKAASDLNELTQKRLGLEKQIADLRAAPNPENVDRTIQKLQMQLDATRKQAEALAPDVLQRSLDQTPLSYGTTKPNFEAGGSGPKTPIDITDPKYRVTDDDKDGGSAKLDRYAREIQQIQERTASINAEVDARSKLDPLINDYGFAVEKAAAKQDLLNAALRAGKQITPELTAEIEKTATAYAKASVTAAKLDESQQNIRQHAEDMREFNKELTRGLIDGFIEGKNAADLFADSLKKIGDRLLDMALDGLFSSKSKGGLDLGLGLSSLLGFRAAGGPVKKGMPYIVGEKRPELFVPDQSGTIIPKLPTSAPTVPNLSQARSLGNVTIDARTTIQASGNSDTDARMMAWAAKRDRELPGQVIRIVQDAQRRRHL